MYTKTHIHTRAYTRTRICMQAYESEWERVNNNNYSYINSELKRKHIENRISIQLFVVFVCLFLMLWFSVMCFSIIVILLSSLFFPPSSSASLRLPHCWSCCLLLVRLFVFTFYIIICIMAIVTSSFVLLSLLFCKETKAGEKTTTATTTKQHPKNKTKTWLV